MDVTNLPINERMKLFNEWVEKRFNSPSSSHGYSIGNEINLTKEQMLDPEYVIPEWGCTIPSWIIEDDLGNKIGMKCSAGISSGTFLGIQVTYEDFYYIIKSDDGKISYCSCVGGIDFYSEDE